MRRQEYGIPDWAYTGLHDGSVERIDYFRDGTAHIVMSYGDTWMVSTRVTDEMRDAEWQKRRQAAIDSGALLYSSRFTAVVDVKDFKGIIYNSVV